MNSYKLEFLMCGSPNNAFYSQAAIYRFFLDSFGGMYKDARLVLVLGDYEKKPLPDRWKPYFENIEVHWADHESFLIHGDGSEYLFSLIDDRADLSFICDADTLLVRPFSRGFLSGLLQAPAVGGVIAHYSPARTDNNGNNFSRLSSEELWQMLADHVLGKSVDMPFIHTLADNWSRCPFYINYGFVASTPKLLKELHRHLVIVQPKIREVLDNDFFGQVGIALAVERGHIPVVSLPMRYNFPNDPLADERYGNELKNVHVIHYLRTNLFDRHMIFKNRRLFNEFLDLDLSGSNAVFQQFIRETTGGKYPFPSRSTPSTIKS